MCTLGKGEEEEEDDDDDDDAWSVDVAAVSVGGVGPSETLMMCSRPARWMASTTSPLKKSISMDLSWMNRGCESKRSEAKWSSGLCPGVAFCVWSR